MLSSFLSVLLAVLLGCGETSAQGTIAGDADASADVGAGAESDVAPDAEVDVAPDADVEVITINVAPDDPGIRYVGGWNQDDPMLPSVGWQGASASLRFNGTDVQATLQSSGRPEYFRVIVDGDHLGSTRFAVDSDLQTYSLAEGLTLGAHEVEIVKETYVSSASTSVAFHGFTVVGTALLSAPVSAERHMEFYDVSNLAKNSLTSEVDESGQALNGSHFTYAGIVARAFGADYHNISTSSETLSGMTNRYNRVFYGGRDSEWDFDRYTPDVVVMNLGANDIYVADERTIRRRYVVMLDLLRAAHPLAHIVGFNAWGWDFAESANYIAEVVDTYGDPNVSVSTFPWVFEQWHGSETAHAGMARSLMEHIERELSWEASTPEVRSGLGRDGDVANCGFETAAPFGGYGWRYYPHDGVERVEDAAESQDGQFFLRLSDRASVHQPNPARGGDVVSVRLWLKGATEDDRVDVTVDFRNEEMWTDPIQSATITAALTTEWAEHILTATAPDRGPTPVFPRRLTLGAKRGVTIDVDSISMIIE